MTDNKEREALLLEAAEHLSTDGHFMSWPDAKRAAALIRKFARQPAALAASQEKVEPVEMEPTLPVNVYGKLFSVPIPVHVHLVGLRMQIEELEAAPVAAQASEPLRKTFEEWLGEVVADGGCTVEALLVGDADPIRCARSAWDACIASLAAAPQPSAEAVRDAALEEAANTATGFLVGDPLAGIPLRNPMTHEIAAAIRALKSAPPQPAEQPDEYMCPNCVTPWKCNGPHILPAEQPSASPAALTERDIETMQDVATELSAYLELYPTTHGLSALCLKFRDLIARAQGEQA